MMVVLGQGDNETFGSDLEATAAGYLSEREV